MSSLKFCFSFKKDWGWKSVVFNLADSIVATSAITRLNVQIEELCESRLLLLKGTQSGPVGLLLLVGRSVG